MWSRISESTLTDLHLLPQSYDRDNFYSVNIYPSLYDFNENKFYYSKEKLGKI